MLTVKNAVRVLCAVLLVAGLAVSTGSNAVARPKYKDAISALYPELTKKHGVDGKLSCAVCHPGKSKKDRNNYGVAFGDKLEKKNETAEAKITEALKAAAKEKSATDGKTFGDLIDALELPGTDEKAN